MKPKKKQIQIITSVQNKARLEKLAKVKAKLIGKKCSVNQYIKEEILQKRIQKELLENKGARIQKHQKRIFSDVYLCAIHAPGSLQKDNVVNAHLLIDSTTDQHLARMAKEYGMSKASFIHSLISAKCLGVR